MSVRTIAPQVDEREERGLGFFSAGAGVARGDSCTRDGWVRSMWNGEYHSTVRHDVAPEGDGEETHARTQTRGVVPKNGEFNGRLEAAAGVSKCVIIPGEGA